MDKTKDDINEENISPKSEEKKRKLKMKSTLLFF